MQSSATLGPQGVLKHFHLPSCRGNGANGGACAPKGYADHHVGAHAASGGGVAGWGLGGTVPVVSSIKGTAVKRLNGNTNTMKKVNSSAVKANAVPDVTTGVLVRGSRNEAINA